MKDCVTVKQQQAARSREKDDKGNIIFSGVWTYIGEKRGQQTEHMVDVNNAVTR